VRPNWKTRLVRPSARRAAFALGVVALAGVFTSAALASAATVIGSATKAKLGRVLVDSQGRTLYTFTRDPQTRSECSGSCAGRWAPVLGSSIAIKPGSGLNAKLVGTIARPTGQRQAAYDHHPLYRYLGDTSSHPAAGEGANQFGGYWYALNRQGDEVKPKGSGPCSPVCGGY
jgi:predicted lipoprotein with Yx(FWY)xxD motif